MDVAILPTFSGTAQYRPGVEDMEEGHIQFRGAFDHAPIGMALVATDGRWLEVNGALCSILGYGADELARLRWQDLTHADDLDSDERLLEGLLAGDADCGLREKRFLRSDGRAVWVQLSVSLVHGTGDAGDYFIHQVQDISARKRVERISEQQALLFNALHDAAIVTDVDARITEWNPAAAQMFGLTAGEASGRHVGTLVVGHGAESPAVMIEALRQVGRWSGELDFRRAGGQMGVAEVTAVTIGGPDAGRRAYAVVARDVTERCAAERQVRDHNRQLAALLNIQQSIAHVGPDRAAILHLVADRVLELTPGDGAAVALLEQESMLSVVASGIKDWQVGLRVPLADSLAGACIEQGQILRVDDVEEDPRTDAILGACGACRSAVYVPLLHDGRAIGVLSVVASRPGAFDQSDVNAMQLLAGALAAAITHTARFEENQALVTERSEALAALQATEERFRALIEHARDVIAVLAADGTIEYVSPAITSLLGYRPEDLLGHIDCQYLHPDDAQPLRDLLDEILNRAGSVGSLSFRFRHIDGSWRQLEGRASNLVDHRALGGIVLNVRDVTEARRMEEQLRQAQKLEAIGQLAAGIAHEINTPTQYVGDNVRFLDVAFGDIIGLLDRYQNARSLLAAHPEFAPLSAELGRVSDEADLPYLVAEIPVALTQSLEGLERIAEIVRSVKAFSHPGGDAEEPAELNREIENTVSVSRNEWKYDAEVVLDLAADLPLVHCLVGEINQVILNLIVNAAHAIADRRRAEQGAGKGVITITTRHGDGTVEIRVGDTGSGIPVRVRERLFDPFFTTKEVGRGTGQGLAIARTVITEKHRGSIDFETEMGVGTTFVIRLPVSMDRPAGQGQGS